MKSYSFAPISAREYPTVKILDNPYIWGGVQFCVNLSEKPYSPELEAAMAAHGIEWGHCPVSEEPGADWLESFAVALPKMYRAYKDGKKQIVHCDMGNNRSKSFVEALYYAIVRKEFEDPYKGTDNHFEYNCLQGHLPDIGEMERRIRAMIGKFPNWSMPSEEEMVRLLQEPSPRWTRDGITIQTKANPLNTDKLFRCGTPFLQSLHRAVERFEKGEQLGDGFTVDEVVMTVLDDWEKVGCKSTENDGWVDIYAPLISVHGKTERLLGDDEIEGLKLQRGHEYIIKARRIFITKEPFYHDYKMLALISEKPTQ